MKFEDIKLQSKKVSEANLSENEQEILRLFIFAAINERRETSVRGWRYYDGLQSGIAQTLRLLGRDDLWELIDYEFPYYDDLN